MTTYIRAAKSTVDLEYSEVGGIKRKPSKLRRLGKSFTSTVLSIHWSLPEPHDW